MEEFNFVEYEKEKNERMEIVAKERAGREASIIIDAEKRGEKSAATYIYGYISGLMDGSPWEKLGRVIKKEIAEKFELEVLKND